MSSLDALPPDQRAVLQLVLQRGRGYDDIAGMLAIDRAAVRQRALGAFDELGPQTRVPAERRALITDYLLGQLPPRVSEQVRGRLSQSASERAWARVIAAELAPLAAGPLPDIPVETARRAPDFEEDEPAQRPTASAAAPAASPPSTRPETEAAYGEEADEEEPAGELSEPTEAGAPPDVPLDSEPRARSRAPQAEEASRAGRGQRGGRSPAGGQPSRRSSRRGGVILLTVVGLAIVAGIVIAIASSGSGNDSHTSSAAASGPTGTTTASTPTGATGTSTPTTTTAPKVIAQINLKPPPGAGKAAGIAEVLKQGTNTGIAIVAQGVPPNTTKPPNAYAVWLYNSASDSHLLGFVNPGVGKNGRLSTAGGLPANASHYHQVIVTVETQNNPRTPGQVILSGALTGV